MAVSLIRLSRLPHSHPHHERLHRQAHQCRRLRPRPPVRQQHMCHTNTCSRRRQLHRAVMANMCVSCPLIAQVARPARATRRTTAMTPRNDRVPALQPSSLSGDDTTRLRSRRRASTEGRTLQHEHERAPSSSTAVRPRRKRARPRSDGVALGRHCERHHQGFEPQSCWRVEKLPSARFFYSWV